MGLFAKPVFKDLLLPFRYVRNSEDHEAGSISIEAYGDVFGEYKYCYASYELSKGNMYDNGDYEQMIDLLTEYRGKEIKVVFRFKNDKLKNFRIDLNSLSCVCGDERFKEMGLLGWGLNDKPFEEVEAEYESRNG